jgi:hypothetical protein
MNGLCPLWTGGALRIAQSCPPLGYNPFFVGALTYPEHLRPRGRILVACLFVYVF